MKKSLVIYLLAHLSFWTALVKAEYEEGYGAFYEERLAKATKPIDYPDFRFKVKKKWMQLSDENKFFWWWTQKYGMSASEKDKQLMKQYKATYFSIGKKIESAPNYSEFLKKDNEEK